MIDTVKHQLFNRFVELMCVIVKSRFEGLNSVRISYCFVHQIVNVLDIGNSRSVDTSYRRINPDHRLACLSFVIIPLQGDMQMFSNYLMTFLFTI